jgi:hypothetical protein
LPTVKGIQKKLKTRDSRINRLQDEIASLKSKLGGILEN